MFDNELCKLIPQIAITKTNKKDYRLPQMRQRRYDNADDNKLKVTGKFN